MNSKPVHIVVAAVSALLFYVIFYLLERHQNIPLLVAYTFLFVSYLFFAYNRNKLRLKELIGLAIAFRLLAVFSVPTLSDDFYRFIWDGILWSNGINPFAFLPSEIIHGELIPISDFTRAVFAGLNSPSTYTVYPTLPQLINLLSFKIGSESLLANIIVQRLIIISADLLSIYFLIKILKQRGWDKKLVTLYALNPLVIIELSGNLHHEALMIAFFLGFIYYEFKQKPVSAGILLALSIGSKLLPLMFLPFILLRTKNRLKLIIALTFGILLLAIPIIDQSFILGMKSSLLLYYQKFEFNAGLYFLARELGYWYYGYNAIALIGQVFFVTSVLLIILVSILGYLRKISPLFIYSAIYLIYASFSLILHPWYIIMLIALAPLTKFRFSLTWSYLIFLTYVGYTSSGFSENYWLVCLEYFGVLLALYFDWRNYALDKETLKAAP